jgi:zinc protease
MNQRLICSFFLLIFILLTGITAAELESQADLSTLSNGMQVIMLEKHANPLVACMIYVNAGSKYETDKNNGVTHFLEHLLFDGTKTRSRVDITEGIKAKGGYINAFTQKELTCYMVLMPSDYIEDGLAIQSDMLFNSSFADSELAKERKVVIEEIKKDEDNIDNQVETFFDSVAYAGTPYARPVIGSDANVSNLTKQEIVDYYHTYYEPNNMIALVIGDFQTDRMKSLLQKYYGQKTAGTLPPIQSIKWISPSDREVKYREVKAENTYVNICFDAPRFDDPAYFDFDMLTEVLNLEASSPLYQALTQGQDPLVTQISANLQTEKEFSSLNLSFITNSPEKADSILKTTVKVLQEFTQKPLEQKLLQNVIVSSKTHRYYQEERLHFYGMMAAPLIVTSGWKFWDTFIDNLEKVTPETLQQTSKKYFSEPKYIATVVNPTKK